ncbi:MAG: hypothetical protein M9928_02700 [Anaerolineae bacterium]|nr:hypothetical protein [Anaerolineae bacterium]MCO5198830.1 hypothetical protein [Anaerolineae bacterium]MCO5203914.1 hypothetical protein [Anaerolineae bacterium]
MRPIQQELTGKLFDDGDRAALWIAMEEDGISAENYPVPPVALYVRYALVLFGSDAPFFPAFLLDDWGNEIRGRKLYTWVRREGYLYPRAELFGFDHHGRETQRFVREIEINERYYCYVYSEKQAETSAGCLVHDIVIADKTAAAAELIKTPDYVTVPLRSARVHWHRLPLNLLAKQPLPI